MRLRLSMARPWRHRPPRVSSALRKESVISMWAFKKIFCATPWEPKHPEFFSDSGSPEAHLLYIYPYFHICMDRSIYVHRTCICCYFYRRFRSFPARPWNQLPGFQLAPYPTTLNGRYGLICSVCPLTQLPVTEMTQNKRQQRHDQSHNWFRNQWNTAGESETSCCFFFYMYFRAECFIFHIAVSVGPPCVLDWRRGAEKQPWTCCCSGPGTTGTKGTTGTTSLSDSPLPTPASAFTTKTAT